MIEQMRENLNKEAWDYIGEIGMMLEVAMGYVLMGATKQAMHHLEVAQSMCCQSWEEMEKQAKLEVKE
jgi:hypothetical protein